MAPNPALAHESIVRDVRHDAQMRPPGAERAWRVTNEVALRLQAEGEDAGLCAQPSGVNVHGTSLDRVCYRTGEVFSCLYDAEGEARPQWVAQGTVDPRTWRPPVLMDAPAPPVEPLLPPTSEIVARLDVLVAIGQAQTEVLEQIQRCLEAPLHVKFSGGR